MGLVYHKFALRLKINYNIFMQRTIQYKNMKFQYTYLIKNVKNINLHITQKGEIVVSCNAYVPVSKVDDFVLSKVKWILDKSIQIQKKKEMIENNQIIMYLGNKYEIKRIKSNHSYVKIVDSICNLYIKENDDEQKVLMNFYKEQASKILSKKMKEVYEMMVIDYPIHMPSLKIRNMTSRWGSCMPKKNQITLNTQLIHYDERFIEYVVIHEFAHLIQPNHSKAFYRVIEKYMPDYKNISKNGPKWYLEEK